MATDTITSAASDEEIRRQILDFLREHPDQAYRSHEMASALHIDDNDLYLRFCDAVAELASKKLVDQQGRTYKHKPQANRRTGVLQCNPNGFGFVRATDSDEEFFIREHNMGEALHGDVVRVGVAAKAPGDKKRECEVVQVLERRRDKIVGTLHKRGHYGFVEPDDQRILQDVYVAKEDFNGASDGQKVIVSVDRFDDRKASPEGRILSVLGDADDPKVRVLSLAKSMDVETDFPSEVEQEAAEIPEEIPQKALQRRKDLRDYPIFTVDPADAKDFDDAIHVLEKDNGNLEVGVHIADVSYYVEPGSEIDQEGFERATSVYLVDRTVPMLPEKLSNKVCSLRPKEDKLAFSVLMEVTRGGKVKDYEITETVIHSQQRMTYDEAQTYIDGGYPDHDLAEHVVRANRLAKTLTKKRMREGSVDFGSDEVKVILDDDGHPTDIVRKQRMPANRMIEELMLLANRTVAKHVGGEDGDAVGSNGQYSHRDDPLPFIYRIHDEPDSEGIQKLAEYVKVFGHEVPLTDGNVTSQDLGDLIDEVRGEPEEIVITRAALRAMSKAKYSVSNIGHYGLGFPYYTHFTSPIRRYPDLMVHRLLKRYARGGKAVNVDELAQKCEHCSEQERNAQEAERESVKLKQVEYAESHVGDVFEGVVSGVTKFGVFVELKELLVEGLVHVREMNDDYFVYDESTYTMRGENTGKSYRPGDEVTVKIIGANVDKRQIDLVFQ